MPAFGQQDTTAPTKQKAPPEQVGHQLRLGFDISKPIVNAVVGNREAYELTLDYYLKKEVYLVVEGGWGNAGIDYPDLKYTSTNSFVKAGINKCLLPRMFHKDWDMAFIGARYGVGFIRRSDASFETTDSLWGNTTGSTEGKTFTAYWAEVTGGVRVELLHGLFAGWDVRGKFLFNSTSFRELPPAFIAGYGKGDKSVVFDFNFYLCYALRWGGK